MSVFRIHLKQNGADHSYAQVLRFCRENHMIGVGWSRITCSDDRNGDALYRECTEKTEHPKERTKAFKALNTMRQMRSGDFIWTREGGTGSALYYLCKVDRVWSKRPLPPPDDYIRYDCANCVGCEWLCIGTEDKVPGHVVNSFRAGATAQHVYGVDNLTAVIWNRCCSPDDRVPAAHLKKEDFWNLIGPEELECLVMLYLQVERGYYIYSSTVKRDTKKIEAVLIAKDGSHRCYPQVKQNVPLHPKDYCAEAQRGDRIVLFSSSERYGEPAPGVECLTRETLAAFMINHRALLPGSVRMCLDFIDENQAA